jgi:hypothetical protein
MKTTSPNSDCAFNSHDDNIWVQQELDNGDDIIDEELTFHQPVIFTHPLNQFIRCIIHVDIKDKYTGWYTNHSPSISPRARDTDLYLSGTLYHFNHSGFAEFVKTYD